MGFTLIHSPSVFSDSLAPAQLALRANLRLPIVVNSPESGLNQARLGVGSEAVTELTSLSLTKSDALSP